MKRGKFDKAYADLTGAKSTYWRDPKTGKMMLGASPKSPRRFKPFISSGKIPRDFKSADRLRALDLYDEAMEPGRDGFPDSPTPPPRGPLPQRTRPFSPPKRKPKHVFRGIDNIADSDPEEYDSLLAAAAADDDSDGKKKNKKKKSKDRSPTPPPKERSPTPPPQTERSPSPPPRPATAADRARSARSRASRQAQRSPTPPLPPKPTASPTPSLGRTSRQNSSRSPSPSNRRSSRRNSNRSPTPPPQQSDIDLARSPTPPRKLASAYGGRSSRARSATPSVTFSLPGDSTPARHEMATSPIPPDSMKSQRSFKSTHEEDLDTMIVAASTKTGGRKGKPKRRSSSAGRLPRLRSSQGLGSSGSNSSGRAKTTSRATSAQRWAEPGRGKGARPGSSLDLLSLPSSSGYSSSSSRKERSRHGARNTRSSRRPASPLPLIDKPRNAPTLAQISIHPALHHPNAVPPKKTKKSRKRAKSKPAYAKQSEMEAQTDGPESRVPTPSSRSTTAMQTQTDVPDGNTMGSIQARPDDESELLAAATLADDTFPETPKHSPKQSPNLTPVVTPKKSPKVSPRRKRSRILARDSVRNVAGDVGRGRANSRKGTSDLDAKMRDKNAAAKKMKAQKQRSVSASPRPSRSRSKKGSTGKGSTSQPPAFVRSTSLTTNKKRGASEGRKKPKTKKSSSKKTPSPSKPTPSPSLVLSSGMRSSGGNRKKGKGGPVRAPPPGWRPWAKELKGERAGFLDEDA